MIDLEHLHYMSCLKSKQFAHMYQDIGVLLVATMKTYKKLQTFLVVMLYSTMCKLVNC